MLIVVAGGLLLREGVPFRLADTGLAQGAADLPEHGEGIAIGARERHGNVGVLWDRAHLHSGAGAGDAYGFLSPIAATVGPCLPPLVRQKNSFTCADLRSNNILYLTPKVNNVL
jgi:hypothetical protein